MKEVAPGIFQIKLAIPFFHIGEVNLYFLRDEKPALLESGPGFGLTEVIFDELCSGGVDVKELVYLIPTHEHPDHFGGNAAFKKRHPALQIVSHPVAAQNYHNVNFSPAPEIALKLPEALLQILRQYQNQFQEAAEISAQVFLEHGDVLDLGSRKLKAVHSPGHAAGHLCFFDERNKILFAGDNIIGSGTPYVGASAAFSGNSERRLADGDMSAYLDSLRRLDTLSIETILPAHGPICKKERIQETIQHKLNQIEEVYRILDHNGPLQISETAEKLYAGQNLTKILITGSTEGYMEKLVLDGRVRQINEDGQRKFKAVAGIISIYDRGY